jgi:adenine/guanine/hypoxanthine permease
VGTILYYALGPLGLAGEKFAWPTLSLSLAFPLPTLGFIDGFADVLPYLPIAIPFGLLTIVGGINVTESARVAGDAYRTRDILLTEAIATLVAGLCGGVSQSTPYISHPAYKAMGARAAYTLATGLFVGLGGILGYVQFVVALIPKAAVVPLLVFIGLSIVNQAYREVPRAHTSAVTFAFLPIIAQLGLILVKPIALPLFQLLKVDAQHTVYTLAILGNGFIVTGMLWGAALAHLIDRKLIESAVFWFVCAAFTVIGLIHSVRLDGSMYLPWAIGEGAKHAFTIAGAYALLGAALLAVGLVRKPIPADEP